MHAVRSALPRSSLRSSRLLLTTLGAAALALAGCDRSADAPQAVSTPPVPLAQRVATAAMPVTGSARRVMFAVISGCVKL